MIKKLASCVREYKKAAILTPTYVSIEVILEVIIPFLMAFCKHSRTKKWCTARRQCTTFEV